MANAQGNDALAAAAAGIAMTTAAGYGALALARRGRDLLGRVGLDHGFIALRLRPAQATPSHVPGSAGDGSNAHEQPDTPRVDPAVIKNCAIQHARVHRALTLVHDGSPEPDDTDPQWDSRKNWVPVEANIGAQFRPIAYDGDPRFTAYAKTVRDKINGIDKISFAVDDGKTGHLYTFVNVEGEVLVFDTLIDAPHNKSKNDDYIPRVRNYYGDERGGNKWEPKFDKVKRLFAADLTLENGVLTPVDEPLPRYRHIRHPHKLLGPPPTNRTPKHRSTTNPHRRRPITIYRGMGQPPNRSGTTKPNHTHAMRSRAHPANRTSKPIRHRQRRCRRCRIPPIAT